MPIAAFIGVYSRVFWLGRIAAFGKYGYRTSQIIFFFNFFFKLTGAAAAVKICSCLRRRGCSTTTI